jgi:hypothetical protein
MAVRLPMLAIATVAAVACVEAHAEHPGRADLTIHRRSWLPWATEERNHGIK